MNSEMKTYSEKIRKNISVNYKGMFREAGGSLNYPFLTPGSDQYADVLWDWDSWLTNVAIRQVLKESGTPEDLEQAQKYEQGCVHNYLDGVKLNGWLEGKDVVAEF